jgi:hypothetical protein
MPGAWVAAMHPSRPGPTRPGTPYPASDPPTWRLPPQCNVDSASRERARRSAAVSGYGQCRTCHRRILWATSARSGKPHPFDPDPNWTRGNWLIDADDQAHQLSAAHAAALRHERESLYLSHFDSCAHRSEHRRLMPPGPYEDLDDEPDA